VTKIYIPVRPTKKTLEITDDEENDDKVKD
jgi:hypothetical protein